MRRTEGKPWSIVLSDIAIHISIPVGLESLYVLCDLYTNESIPIQKAKTKMPG